MTQRGQRAHSAGLRAVGPRQGHKESCREEPRAFSFSHRSLRPVASYIWAGTSAVPGTVVFLIQGSLCSPGPTWKLLMRPGCPLSLQGLGLRVWLATRPICLGFEAGSLTEHKHLADLTDPLGSSSLRNPRFWNDRSILVRSWCGCCDLESCVFAWQWLSPPSPPTTPQIISFTSVPTGDRTRPGVIDLSS